MLDGLYFMVSYLSSVSSGTCCVVCGSWSDVLSVLCGFRPIAYTVCSLMLVVRGLWSDVLSMVYSFRSMACTVCCLMFVVSGSLMNAVVSLVYVYCPFYRSQKGNTRALNHELKKLNDQEKVALAEKLMSEVAMNDPKKKGDFPPYQDSEFDNPFNTKPPAVRGTCTSPDGVVHNPALSPDKFVPLKYVSTKGLGEKQAEFKFALPNPSDHTGCLPGQYVQISVKLAEGKLCQRFFSPVSGTSEFGQITLVMKFESRGILTQHFKKMKPGMTSASVELYDVSYCRVV